MRHIYGTLFDNTGQPIFTIFFSKTEARKQGNRDTERYSTLRDPQDVSTNRIWDSYIK